MLALARPYLTPERDGAGLTEADHETWRQLLVQTRALLSQYSLRIHPAYLAGFQLLFGDSHCIPSIDEVNRKLKCFNWQAVLVDGYLPHAEYARLLVARTFPVARHIRSRGDASHSPVPDLAHDMIGHLPMLLDVHHREFLQRIGAEMSCAVSDAKDHRLYLAQQRAGYLRQTALRSAAMVRAADAEVARVEAEIAREPSQVALLSRFYLWTIEFGLLGDTAEWVAYGAALLSSGRELHQLMSGGAQIYRLSAEAMKQGISFCDLQRGYYVARDHFQVQRELDQVLLMDESCETPSNSRESYVVTRPRT
jgi:phenylalanine-4-hydroxylase